VQRAGPQSPYAPPAAESPPAFTYPPEIPTEPPIAEAPSPTGVLPQRVPAQPDVPIVPEDGDDPPAETPELARIATHLRRDDVPASPRERPEGFDVNAVLAAVRGVPGVRDASLRTTPAGAHSLRLDLADGADAAIVSREVARLLQERLGLAAAPQPGTSSVASAAEQAAPHSAPAPPPGFVPAEPGFVPAQPAPAEAGDNPRFGRRRAGATGRSRFERRAVESGYALQRDPYAGATPYPEAYGADPTRVVEPEPSSPLVPNGRPGPRVLIEQVQVSTFGLDATVEVRLSAGERRAVGLASGPAVDGYVLRLCAVAAASAVDHLLSSARLAEDRGRCFVEHAAVVPFGSSEVAVVVVLLVCGGWVEQLAGSALVSGDPRQAVVRATLAAVNRRLEALL
jgi:hypothetical protein